MNSKQALPFWLLLVLALAWTFLSLQWYVCGIKGFCGTPTRAHMVRVAPERVFIAMHGEWRPQRCLHMRHERFIRH
jgi:hypothetical protein